MGPFQHDLHLNWLWNKSSSCHKNNRFKNEAILNRINGRQLFQILKRRFNVSNIFNVSAARITKEQALSFLKQTFLCLFRPSVLPMTSRTVLTYCYKTSGRHSPAKATATTLMWTTTAKFSMSVMDMKKDRPGTMINDVQLQCLCVCGHKSELCHNSYKPLENAKGLSVWARCIISLKYLGHICQSLSLESLK